MSIQAVAWALEQDLPARPKLVLVSIANHANHTDGYCYLKAKTIAKEAACTSRSVYTFVGGLVRNGFIRKVLRRGEDGKQRANDYWIVFERDEKEWDWGANPESDVADGEAPESDGATTYGGSDTEPHEQISCGPHERHDTRQAVDKHVPSPGPSEAAFTRKRIAEPSESNSKASSAGGRVRSAALRSYRPPPPQAIAADTEHKSNPVFVYEGTRAWEAWSKHEARKRGLSKWTLTTRAFVNDQWRTGWYFPTLFPPEGRQQGPPTNEMSDSEMRDFK